MFKWFKNLQPWDQTFWMLFLPAILFTIWGLIELYTVHFDELTRQHHMQFFLRIFFPVSLAALVTALERRKRLRENKELQQKIKKYLDE